MRKTLLETCETQRDQGRPNHGRAVYEDFRIAVNNRNRRENTAKNVHAAENKGEKTNEKGSRCRSLSQNGYDPYKLSHFLPGTADAYRFGPET